MIRQSILKRLDKMEAAFIHRPTAREQEQEQFLQDDPEAVYLLEQIRRLKDNDGKTYVQLFENSEAARKIHANYLNRYREWCIGTRKT